MQEEKTEHVQGKPWKTEGKFQTYQEALALKEQLASSENPPEELKIKHMNSSKLFLVKSRKKEEVNKNKKKKT